MWSPTHVQVTVQRARGLLTKGKNGTNDAFVTIGLGKEKYQTSLKEKAVESVEWHEKCELQIPKQGNTAEIVLTVFHHNFLGVDEFLGCINIPLAEMDVYERPRNRWYKLKSKPGKDKGKEGKERGDLEVKVAFIVKSGSLADLSKKEKHKSSLGQLSNALGGSLISISSLDKRKSLKKTLGKIGNKMKIKHKSKETVSSETGSLRDMNKLSGTLGDPVKPSQQRAGDADPGVISEGESEDDFTVSDHDPESPNLRPDEAERLRRMRHLALGGFTDEDPIPSRSHADSVDFRNNTGVVWTQGDAGTDHVTEQSGVSLSPTLSNSYVHYEDLEYTKDFLQKERDYGSYSIHSQVDNGASGLANIEEIKEIEFEKEKTDDNAVNGERAVNNAFHSASSAVGKPIVSRNDAKEIEFCEHRRDGNDVNNTYNGCSAKGNPILYWNDATEIKLEKERSFGNTVNQESQVNNGSYNGLSDEGSTAEENTVSCENEDPNLNVTISDRDPRTEQMNELTFIEIETHGDHNDCSFSETNGVEEAFVNLLPEGSDVGLENVEDAFENLLQTKSKCNEDGNKVVNGKFVEIRVTDTGYNLSNNDLPHIGSGEEGGFTSYVFDDADQLDDEFERLVNENDLKENKDTIGLEQLGKSKLPLVLDSLNQREVKEKQLNLNYSPNGHIIDKRNSDINKHESVDSACNTIPNSNGFDPKDETTKKISRSDEKLIKNVSKLSKDCDLYVTDKKSEVESNLSVTEKISNHSDSNARENDFECGVDNSRATSNNQVNRKNISQHIFVEEYSNISSPQCPESMTGFYAENDEVKVFSNDDDITESAYDSVSKYLPAQKFTSTDGVQVNGCVDGSPVGADCSRGRNKLSGAKLVGEIFKSWQNLADMEDLDDTRKEQILSCDLLDDLSHKGSGYSLETGANSTPKSGSLENLAGGEFLRKSDIPPAKPPRIINPPEPVDEWEQKLYGKYGKEAMNLEPTGTLRRINSFNPQAVSSPVANASAPTPAPASAPAPNSAPAPAQAPAAPTEELCKPSEDNLSQDFKKSPTLSIPSKSSSIKSSMERIIIGGERESDFVCSRSPPTRLSTEVVKQFDGKSREELIEIVVHLQSEVKQQKKQQRDLEDYLDQLLLRVMETSPRILQNPYLNCKTQAKIM